MSSISRPQPASRHLPARQADEANVARLGLISVHERIPDGYNEWSVVISIDGEEAHLTCEALPQYGGVPHGLDNDVSLALITLYIEDGCPEDGSFTTTAYQILRTIDLDTSGHYYRALQESLNRLRGALYTATRSWRDHGERKWVTVKFNFLDRLEYTSDRDRDSLSSASMLRIRLAQEIVQSVRARYVKPLDLSFLTSLKRPQTRALFRLLDAHRYDPQDLTQPVLSLEVPVTEWGKACKLHDPQAHKVRRALEGAHQELIERGYLKSVEYEGRGSNQTIRYNFTPVCAPEFDLELLGNLTSHGVAAPIARNLILEYGEPRIQERLKRFDALVASGYRPRSKGALLVDVIRDEQGKYANPELLLGQPRGKDQAREQDPGRERNPGGARRDTPKPQPDDDQEERRWASMTSEQRAQATLRQLQVMLGKRLSSATYARLLSGMLAGRLDALTVKREATRAAMNMALEEFAAELAHAVELD